MPIKVTCIDEQHAICVDVNPAYNSVRVGRDVVVDVDRDSNIASQIMTYGMGFHRDQTWSCFMENRARHTESEWWFCFILCVVMYGGLIVKLWSVWYG